MDRQKIEEGVRLILEGIGEDPKREGLADTPYRISSMCEEIFGGYTDDAKVHLQKTFASKTSDIVIEKDIPFYSVCEHHLLPFFGTVSIGYVPDGRVVGLSKLARTVETYAKRAQIQEQMTSEITEAICKYLSPKGVIVAVSAEHLCMSMRGVRKPGTKTFTYRAEGCFLDNDRLKDEFFRLIG
ncbi:MAG: GTP cyclohydrolase I FolE [Eubacterium sp.]|nr:GTP cyclohydrolase I FolE [Eubacterium sp.]